MAGGGGGQASPGDDSALNVIWAIVALFAIGVLIWITFSEQLKYCFIQVRKYELLLINTFIKILPLDLLNFGKVKNELTDLVSLVNDLTPESLTLDLASDLSMKVGNYLCYPVSLCLIYFSYYGFFKNISK